MALMFPRIARNFAKAGYYPTDEGTLERVLTAFAPVDTLVSILDPCAGEGVALAEVAHALGREHVCAHAVEFDAERAAHARKLADKCLHADVMDTIISRQAFGLLWFNPPYGDLQRDANGNLGYQGKGRGRLEKLFYQRAMPLLQYDGIIVAIVPTTTLDDEFVGWITNHFADVRVFKAVDRQFRQVVIFGRRVRQRDQETTASRNAREMLVRIGKGDCEATELPEVWTFEPVVVPRSRSEPEHFYRVSMEPEQFAREVERLQGLWPTLGAVFGNWQKAQRRPARALSPWHLALALAAGAITGIVKSAKRIFVIRGDTFKAKKVKKEAELHEDGTLVERTVALDCFKPAIRAWDFTPDSKTFGELMTIS
ncbi:MAG: class I SAM-dependent methyltransferase [Proteobacteria bacterium]|nr:class I SAM-dependent methyltransferase [Pseudomonadota bacterium]